MAVPPGTMRMPSAALKRRAGMVSLSMNDSAPEANSARTPQRKAARIPSFTQVFGVQTPSASRSAARTVPFSSSARKRPMVLSASFRSPSSTCFALGAYVGEPALGEDLLHLLPIALGDRRQRRADGVVLQDAEHLHGRLHRDRVRLDEVPGH